MSIISLTSDTLSSPAAAGNIEYSSPIIAATPIGTQRGVVPTAQYYRLNADLAGANVTTAQNTFGVGVTLSASTVYEFESVFILSKSAGTTSHIPSILFGGSATLNNILYSAYAGAVASSTPSGTDTSPRIIVQNAASSIAISGAATSAALTQIVVLRGSVSVNAGGTFIPQYILSAAPGGAYSTVAGSYILIYPVSASGSNTNVGTWA